MVEKQSFFFICTQTPFILIKICKFISYVAIIAICESMFYIIFQMKMVCKNSQWPCVRNEIFSNGLNKSNEGKDCVVLNVCNFPLFTIELK